MNARNFKEQLFGRINLSYDRGGALCARHFLCIFLLKISPPDQTLRPTCKFRKMSAHILGFIQI